MCPRCGIYQKASTLFCVSFRMAKKNIGKEKPYPHLLLIRPYAYMNGGRRIKKIEYTTKYLVSFKKLPQEIQNRAREKEGLFCGDPFHPQLHTHKLHGIFQDYRSYSVDRRYRVVFRFLDGGKALFFDIGSHIIYQKGE